MPQIYDLNSEAGIWEAICNQRPVLSARETQKMDSVRFSLKDCVIARLQEFRMTDSWPYPPSPDLNSVGNEDICNTEDILLSVDSGTGILKLILRFLTKTPSHSTNEVTLITEARGTSESLEDTQRHFGPICSEIEMIRLNGIQLGDRSVRIDYFFRCRFYANLRRYWWFWLYINV